MYGHQGERRWVGEIERLGLTYTLIMHEADNYKNLLYSRGNCTQYSATAYQGKESKKEWIYVYVKLIHFAVQQKLTQHCKSTILQ